MIKRRTAKCLAGLINHNIPRICWSISPTYRNICTLSTAQMHPNRIRNQNSSSQSEGCPTCFHWWGAPAIRYHDSWHEAGFSEHAWWMRMFLLVVWARRASPALAVLHTGSCYNGVDAEEAEQQRLCFSLITHRLLKAEQQAHTSSNPAEGSVENKESLCRSPLLSQTFPLHLLLLFFSLMQSFPSAPGITAWDPTIQKISQAFQESDSGPSGSVCSAHRRGPSGNPRIHRGRQHFIQNKCLFYTDLQMHLRLVCFFPPFS